MELNGTLKIAIQRSGRLSEGSLALLKAMGLEFEAYKTHLFAHCRNLPIDILFLRDDDIPEYVQNGIADLGIVGRNILEEYSSRIRELVPLDFGYCSLCIAIPEQKKYSSLRSLKRIATSYPETLRRFLKAKRSRAEVILLKGCVEIAPALQVADAICDLVSTGSTIRTNRLKVVEKVAESQAILIGSRSRTQEKSSLIEMLLLRARGVQEAKRYKYIMFNLQKKNLEKVKALVPGAKSPTVMQLAEPGWIAVHSVVEEEVFWETVEKIRLAGGSGILVTPIEKFIR